jgi:phosphate starvation-inducible PhoH-like protein
LAKRRQVRRFTQIEEDMDVIATPSKGERRKKAGNNVVSFNSYVSQRRAPITLIPKSINQETYIEYLLDPSKVVVFGTGPAGTGKTMLAVHAAIKSLKEGNCNSIIITRPAVGVDDEKHGFLPGGLNEKMAPWTRPIFDAMKEYYSPKEIALMLENEIIEISPLAYMRGRSFKNSWIIADEMQNTTVNTMKMVLTRIGENCKMVITGDLNQFDRQYKNSNGLEDFLDRLKLHSSSMISSVTFTNRDIQRHRVITEVLDLYGEI